MLERDISSSQESDKPSKKCGVIGYMNKNGSQSSPLIPRLQGELQHRGYDTAGMATFSQGKINVYTGLNWVIDVFPPDFDFEGENLLSDRGIGHNRYGTSEKNGIKDDLTGAQPEISEWQGKKVALAYNGNLPESMRNKLRSKIPDGLLKEHSFDTTDIADAIAGADGSDWVEKIRNALEGIDLAYSLTILTDDGRVFGLRCPFGTWPLWVGETDDEFVIASETRVEKALEGKKVSWREVKPGELVEITPDQIISRQIFSSSREAVCLLHAVYGASKDSSMTEDGITYKEFRRKMGQILAKEHPIEADLYIGIPSTGIDIAAGYAEALGVVASDDVIKLKEERNGESKTSARGYIARTPEETLVVVKEKYGIKDPSVIEGKRIVILDDTAINGVTARVIVQLFRNAGAGEIFFLTPMPKFVEGCDMGFYIIRGRLIALEKSNGGYRIRTNEEVAKEIGADYFGCTSLEAVKAAFEGITGKKDAACLNCIGGGHPLERNVKEIIFDARDVRSETSIIS